MQTTEAKIQPNREKLLDKITKLLALAGDKGNDNESQTAMLLAQKLMIDNSISIKEVGGFESEDERVPVTKTIWEEERINAVWKSHLHRLIAQNYRCEAYFHGGHASFVGFKEDTEVASLVFLYCLNIIKRGSRRIRKKYRDDGKSTYGVQGDYVTGFLSGLRDRYAEQVKQEGWGLILVTDPRVKQWMQDNCPGTRTLHGRNARSFNQNIVDEGYKDGKNFAEPHTAIGEN